MGYRRRADRHPGRRHRAVAGGRGLRLDRRVLLVEAERDLRDADQSSSPRATPGPISASPSARRSSAFCSARPIGSLLGLSFWWSRNYAAVVQPYIICFESLPKLALAPLVILVFGMGLASKVAIATALTLVVSTLTTYAGVKALDPRRRETVLFARRHALAGVPQAGRAVLPAVDHLGAAGEYRARAHRRHRRRVHRLAARARPRHPLRRQAPTTSRWCGSPCWCSRRSPSSCIVAVSWLERVLRKGMRQ